MTDDKPHAVASNALFDILVSYAGTSETFREDFLRCIDEGCREYRIGGLLGPGGKYWPETNQVTCYREDENRIRKAIIEDTNRQLKAHGGLMSNPSHHAEPRLGGDSVDGVVGTPNQKGEA